MTTRPDKSRSTLLSIQRSMVNRLKNRMKLYVDQTPELKAYYARYRKEVTDYHVPSYLEELMQHVIEADVVYVGDFHTLAPAQKFLVRLIDMVKAHKAMANRRLVVAMETFHSAHQEHIDAFLADRMDFDTLLDRTAYRRNWGFPVQGYQRIVENCAELGVPILAINSSPRGNRPLQRRDRHAARVLWRHMTKNPEDLVLVFIGDLHVARDHLPGELRQLADKAARPVEDIIIYSNPEAIYWKLADAGLEYMVNLVQVGTDHRFAVLNATPVTKYESYLRFVEGVVDDRAWSPRTDTPVANVDVEEQTIELAGRITRFLGLGPLELDDFEVVTFDHQEETVGEMAERYDASPEDVPEIIAALKARQVTFVGPSGVFLHQFTLNDAADLAARLVLRELGWVKPRGTCRNTFFADIIYEALVYFGTKVINPKRTCRRESDLSAWVTRARQRRTRTDYAKMPLRIVESSVRPHLQAMSAALEADRPRQFKVPRGWWQMAPHYRLQATRLLGYRLGERLFYSVHVGPPARVNPGQARFLSRARMTDLFRTPPSDHTDSLQRYLDLWFDTADVVEHHQDRDEWF